MRTYDKINNQKIALSGHSLGAEPAMVLAILNPDVVGLVYSDYLPRLIKEAAVRTMPNDSGVRPQANWLGHSVPGLWKWMDYPDMLASLAPRPLMINEGGVSADLEMIKNAYKTMSASQNIEVHYYPKYSDASSRMDNREVPGGLNFEEYYKYANVDAPNHYFKYEIAVPWLSKVLLK